MLFIRVKWVYLKVMCPRVKYFTKAELSLSKICYGENILVINRLRNMKPTISAVAAAFAVALTALFTFTGCGPKEDPEIAVTGVSLNESSLTIEVGESSKLIASITPSNATGSGLVWSSSNDKVATVNESGNVKAISEGTATITVKAGNYSANCAVSVTKNEEQIVTEVLTELYNAMDGPNWKTQNWCSDLPVNSWEGVTYKKSSGLILKFDNFGLKGDIPDCIGDLACLKEFWLNEKEVTGKLPDSFANLTNLTSISLYETSMTSLPDVFANMKALGEISVANNPEMTGPLPEGLGVCPSLKKVGIVGNRITGRIPDSWARLGKILMLGDNCLTGQIPKRLLESIDFYWLMQEIMPQKSGYGFDISGIDFREPIYWPKDGTIEDLDGNAFSIDDVIKKNKCTVYLAWAPWCPFSKELLPELKAYYDKYHQDGLEIIATVMLTSEGSLWSDKAGQLKEVKEKGYDKWYNFFFPLLNLESYLNHTPSAEVFDLDGNILFSSFYDYSDPVRNRFGKTASYDLIPFLESVFGPADTDESDYASKDYSEDKKVMTLQKATAGKGIDIVFMGDAYTDKDMASGGLYETLMRQSMAEFFAVEPYKTFRDRFNVYAVKVVSKNGWIGDGYTTALSTSFGVGSEVFCDYDKCYEYALKVPSIKSRDNLLVCVLVNTKRHAGTTRIFDDGKQTCVAVFSSNGNDPYIFGTTLRHEAGGHGFAFLGDEYVTSPEPVPQNHVEEYSAQATRLGWWQNIDFTNDPSKVKWSVFLSDDRYKDEVGIYEGGLYGKGVWRPSENSIMNMNFGGFNAPSRWAIYKRIMELSGEEASFEKFLEYDAVNRGKKQPSAPMTRSTVEWQPTAPPIVGL